MTQIDSTIQDIESLIALGLGELTLNDVWDICKLIKSKHIPKNEFIPDFEAEHEFISTLIRTENEPYTAI